MQKIFTGTVRKGTKRAAALGFPTVNIPLEEAGVSGVYVARLVFEGKEYPAAAFADQKRKLLEAHILDFSENVYGKEVLIELLEKIREAQVFDNDTALRLAILKDVENVREYFTRRQVF